MSKLNRWSPVSLLVLLGLALLPAGAMAQALPPVADFVGNLDVRCYNIPNQPPLNLPLTLEHLNPVFIEKGLPKQEVVLKEAQQLCVPVAKNNQMPPSDVLPFIRYVDWKCYGITGPSLDFPIHLDHLNPVTRAMFQNSPADGFVREPQQLCVPVMKNNVAPPRAVLQLIQWLDVECYGMDLVTNLAGQIQLTHLNPLFGDTAPESAMLSTALQLCVPVAKNGRTPPTTVLTHVAYSDVLCFFLQGEPLNKKLRLEHLNPVLRELGLPVENVVVTDSTKICVPVAKNGQLPPTSAPSDGSD